MSVSFDGFDFGSYLLGLITPLLVLFAFAIVSNVIAYNKKKKERRGF